MLNKNFALRRHMEEYCQSNGIAPRIAIETNSLSVIIEMVQIGPLATILPTSIVRTQCGLYSVAISPDLPRKAVNIISRKNGYKSAACLAFTALASDWAARRLKETPVRRLRPCPLSEEFVGRRPAS